RLFVLAGRGLPDRAAAQAADGIAGHRCQAAGAACAGVGAGVPGDRRPADAAGRARLAWRARRSGRPARAAILTRYTARYAAFDVPGAAGAPASPRACNAIAIIDVPPNSMLMPTSSPSAQAAVPGSPAQISAARMRSMMPLTSIQIHRLDRSFLCSNAYMIEATP